MTDSSAAANVPLVRRLYEDFGRGDMPAVLARFAPDIEWTEPEGSPYGGTYRGVAAIVDGVFARLPTDWDGFTVTPAEFIDGGDQVVALGEYGGTSRATGRSFRTPFAQVWTVAGGQVTRFREYSDTVLGQRAMGPGGTGS